MEFRNSFDSAFEVVKYDLYDKLMIRIIGEIVIDGVKKFI